ncbi:hypothetical protein ACRAWF_26680 [Streptomyces sp. L7]
MESGSTRILKAMDKRIDAEMTERVARRLVAHGIGVKGYFILGFPGETQEDLDATVRHVRNLWDISDRHAGDVRASVFEFRPYPGTPVWQTLYSRRLRRGRPLGVRRRRPDRRRSARIDASSATSSTSPSASSSATCP